MPSLLQSLTPASLLLLVCLTVVLLRCRVMERFLLSWTILQLGGPFLLNTPLFLGANLWNLSILTLLGPSGLLLLYGIKWTL